MELNPLRQYFRQPAIYIRLPSNGSFYPDGALERTENNEYPVLPMTTIDEITYRTPDALFNGSAVVSVIQSCIPNIKNAWHMPTMDIDTILVAIRMATYGHELEINTQCPHCTHLDELTVDLRNVIDRIRPPNYKECMDVGDLKIFFKPMSYNDINQNSLRQFEDQKTMQMLQDSELDEEAKVKQLGEVLKKITTFTSVALSQSIAMVQTPQARVVDPAHIAEWLANCDRNLFAKVRDHILNAKAEAELQPLTITCNECKKEYKQTYTLDMTTFFEGAS